MFETVVVTQYGKLVIEAFCAETGDLEKMDFNDIIESGHPHNIKSLASSYAKYYESNFTFDYFAENIQALLRVVARTKLGQETKKEIKTSLKFIEATFMDDDVPPPAKVCVRRFINHLYLPKEQLDYLNDMFIEAIKKQTSTRH